MLNSISYSIILMPPSCVLWEGHTGPTCTPIPKVYRKCLNSPKFIQEKSPSLFSRTPIIYALIASLTYSLLPYLTPPSPTHSAPEIFIFMGRQKFLCYSSNTPSFSHIEEIKLSLIEYFWNKKINKQYSPWLREEQSIKKSKGGELLLVYPNVTLSCAVNYQMGPILNVITALSLRVSVVSLNPIQSLGTVIFEND